MARVCMVLFNNYVLDPRVRREAEALARRGDSVDCVCLCQNNVKELNGVRLFYLSGIKYRGNSLLLLLLRYIQFFCYAFVKVSIEHLREPYDVVQAHTMPDSLIFAGLLPKLLGAKLVLDIHDLMPELYIAKWGSERRTWTIAFIKWIERCCVAFADRTIAVSEPHLDALVAHGNPRKKFAVVLNVPDDRIFTKQKRAKTPEGRFTLLYHGTIPKRAGLDVMLRALVRVREHVPDVRLLILGRGESVEELQALTAELNLTESVEWHSGVPIEQLPAVFAEVDLGVVPYIADAFTRYVLPTKLMEYAATGVPTLVSRLPAVEAYFDSSMVAYFEPGNDLDLAEQILTLYRIPELRAQISSRAFDFTENYNWPQQRQIYFRLIDSLVPDGRSLANRKFERITMPKNDVVVAGLGEVGSPLFDLIARKHPTIGIDIEPAKPTGTCAVLHICYPFSSTFIETTAKYIKNYGPELTIINSTVAPGTTRTIHRLTRASIAYSPIRGKHARLKQDILQYVKFIGGIDRDSALRAQEHFHSIGLKTKLVASPETAEIAKLTETTYFGVLIAWAQEVSRYCDKLKVDYEQVASFYDEINFLPSVRYTPGVIGGHCVMPNIEILRSLFDSDILDAIVESNEAQKEKGQAVAV